MEWTSDLIQVWFFPHGWVPKTILDGTPDPNVDFGKPLGRFQGGCDIDKHFYDHAIVFDTTFCGSWAGSTYHQDGCALTDGLDNLHSCIKFVAENPHAFKYSYWTVNSLRVYKAASSSSVYARSTSDSSSSSGSDVVSYSSTQGSSDSSTQASSSSQDPYSGENTSSTEEPSSSVKVTSSAASTASAVATIPTPSHSKHWHGPPGGSGRRHVRHGRLQW